MGAMGFDPPGRETGSGKVLPTLVAHCFDIGLMSRCECRWNYRLLISWSRVRIPSVPHRGRSSVW